MHKSCHRSNVLFSVLLLALALFLIVLAGCPFCTQVNYAL